MASIEKVKLIQGGMAVYVSTWRLARSVAMERVGETAGTVSGTALDVIYARLLQLGDPGGHVRRGLNAFDDTFGTDIGRKICDRYFIAGGKPPSAHFEKRAPAGRRALSGANTFPSPGGQATTLYAWIECGQHRNADCCRVCRGLACEGRTSRQHLHQFPAQDRAPLIYTLYGAMLAGVDGVAVGAGNPEGLPAVCSQLANHEVVVRNLSVLYRDAAEEVALSFDPKQVAGSRLARSAAQKAGLSGHRGAARPGAGAGRKRERSARRLHYRASYGRGPQCQPGWSAPQGRPGPARLRRWR